MVGIVVLKVVRNDKEVVFKGKRPRSSWHENLGNLGLPGASEMPYRQPASQMERQRLWVTPRVTPRGSVRWRPSPALCSFHTACTHPSVAFKTELCGLQVLNGFCCRSKGLYRTCG